MPSVVYGICAAVFGTIFVIQLLLTITGIGGDQGADAFDDPGNLEHHSGGIFGVLSFRTVTAALAFFGVAGLGGEASGWTALTTLSVALIAGAGALYCVYWLGIGLHRMRADGTADPARSIGCRGTVYLRIPARHGGIGKVQISQQGRTLEYEARTAGGELPVGAAIVVVSYLGSDTVEVEVAA